MSTSRQLNAMTIDVEDYFHVAAFNSVIKPEDWCSKEPRVVENTRKFLDFTNRHQLKATFFVLGWVAEQFPLLVREIAAAGHEIACHGFSHQLVYKQSQEEFRSETERSKKLLEDQAQCSVDGYRAASYSITEQSLWALDIIHELGFTYDSSIYPIRHDRYGLQGGPVTPYEIVLPYGGRLREFPITTVNLSGYRMPVGGGGYFRIYPYPLSQTLLKLRSRQEVAPWVFYLHPWELDPEQPRVEGASALSNFRHYRNLDKVEARLEKLVSTFDFSTMRESLATVENMPEHRYSA